jgi:beta-galactosidase/beta-glucuronidase
MKDDWMPPSGFDELGHGYPRPQLRRSRWRSLNGPWGFAIDADASWSNPEQVDFDRTIVVPYAPETPKSGVGEAGFYQACWYRRRIDVPELEDGERLILHFGAVDYHACVWVDGRFAVEHEGGYAPFEVDVTDWVRGKEEAWVVVRASDDPHDLAKPRGKQDWKLHPHSIWYPRTTGIWQTVWLERAPATRIEYVKWTPNLERWEVGIEARVANHRSRRLSLGVRLRVGDSLVADDRYTVFCGEVTRRIALSDPGIDDFRNELFWSPTRPTIIEAELVLVDDADQILDVVETYTALRSVAVRGDRFVLNGRDYHLRMVLDQGYWPESGLTPPGDEAIRKDIALTKDMGFNGARKHQKIEDPRYLYWADRMGLVVWEEMPSAYRFTERSVERLCGQWLEIMRRDVSHPCIVAWVPFNESWGVPNLPDNAPERHYVQALYHLTKTMDPTRPVVGNDGWESIATDIIGIHDYDSIPQRIGRRYFAHDVLPHLLQREKPGGRQLVLDGLPNRDHPLILSEFGGLSLVEPGAGTWGYSECAGADELRRRYVALLEVVRSLELLAGFCYTQFTDTYQEANGLLRADRTPKFPIEVIRAATLGMPMPAEVQLASAADAGLSKGNGA